MNPRLTAEQAGPHSDSMDSNDSRLVILDSEAPQLGFVIGTGLAELLVDEHEEFEFRIDTQLRLAAIDAQLRVDVTFVVVDGRCAG